MSSKRIRLAPTSGAISIHCFSLRHHYKSFPHFRALISPNRYSATSHQHVRCLRYGRPPSPAIPATPTSSPVSSASSSSLASSHIEDIQEFKSVIIVGAGAFGAATAYTLASRGIQVTLVDTAQFPNPRAASHDIAKIVRDDYPDLLYMRMMAKAMPKWRNHTLYKEWYHETGMLRADPVDHERVVHADCDRLETAVLLHGRFQSSKRAVYFGVEYFSSSQLSGTPIQKLSMVEYGEAVSGRVTVCFGAVAEDYIARGSTVEPLLEFCYKPRTAQHVGSEK